MKLDLLLRDTEYRDALVKRISNYDNDIFVNIMDGSEKSTSGSLVLTDVKPSELEEGVIDAIRDRTVFLTDTEVQVPDDCYGLFKYADRKSVV